jgi:ubiquinone/menaquinone biosynthesis C-methylase UbiE
MKPSSIDLAIRSNRTAHDNVAESYNAKHFEIYNSFEQRRLAQLVDKLTRLLPQDKLYVLDFGAGTGNLTKLFLANNCSVVASDVSPKSLAALQREVTHASLKTVVLHGDSIPFADDTFDITATYSVLHHIPDYLAAVKEMVRVTKSGGLIFIEHEANENKWKPSEELQQYYALTKQTLPEHIVKLYRTGELFTFDFIKGVLIRLYDKRYQREGDIHVWPDDHIEWQKIFDVCQNTCRLIEQRDYLLYKPKISVEEYEKFATTCSDMKYAILQKI